MKIQDTSVSISNEKESFDGSTVELGVGGIKHRFYKTDVAIPHFPGGLEEALEWEIEFSSPPTSSTISFDVEFSPGLRFCYQGKLTSEEISNGAERPDEVVGSYAVYWKERNNEYGTGKFCHIYRPKLTDNNGQWTWAEISIDPALRRLTYKIDLAWMSSAAYPVVLGGTKLGKTDVGGSTTQAYDDTEYYIDVGTAVSSGTIDNLAVRNADPNIRTNYKLMLYDTAADKPKNLLEYTTQQNPWGGHTWHIVPSSQMTQGYSIVSGTHYWVGAWFDGGNGDFAYDADATSEGAWYDGRSYSDVAPQNPAVLSTHILDGNRVSAYVEYTAAATPPSGGSGMSLPLRQIVIRRK